MSNIKFTHAELNALISVLMFAHNEFHDCEELLVPLLSARSKIVKANLEEWKKKGEPL